MTSRRQENKQFIYISLASEKQIVANKFKPIPIKAWGVMFSHTLSGKFKICKYADAKPARLFVT